MPNARKIKARMVELGLTQKDISKALNLAPATISQKFNGIRPMSLQEAQDLSVLLKIEDADFGDYFFI